MKLHDRSSGALVGLAVGDALGTTVEFRPRGSFPPVTDMVGGGPFGLAPGAWTDDTSMALCLADSLLGCGRFDERDQMERFVRWWREGERSATGKCFDIGVTTQAALQRFVATGDPLAGSPEPHTAGNGSLMRLAPVVLFAHPDAGLAVELSGRSSRTTHAAPEAVDACRLLGWILHRALAGHAKEQLLVGADAFLREPRLLEVARGGWKDKPADGIVGSGYSVHSLEAALWSFWHSTDFESAVLSAVNLGDDADTTGAIAGQIAGAHYGLSGIPERWRQRVLWAEEIAGLGVALQDLQRTSVSGLLYQRQ